MNNGAFCVNTLCGKHEDIAKFFAKSTNDKRAALSGEEWVQTAGGCYALSDAIISFDCRVIESKTVGTHDIIIGLVDELSIGAGEEILLYHRRSFKII